MATGLIINLVVGTVLLVTLLTVVVLRSLWQGQRARETAALAATADGPVREFPVRATYTRAGFLQGGESKNSMRPRLRVDANTLHITILKTWQVAFQDIRQIEARKTITGGVALIFRVDAASRIFVVRFGEAGLARQVLALMPKTTPIDQEAAMLRDGNAAAATPGLSRYGGRLG